MIDQEKPSKVQLSCKRHDWAPGQTTRIQRLTVDATLASLAAPGHGTTPSRTVLVKNDCRVDGAIGVQVWVDLPLDVEFADARARSALDDAVDAVDRLARNRCEWLGSEFGRALTRWVRAATEATEADSEADDWSEPADVRVQCLSGLNVAFVSVDYRVRRSDGRYDEARSLRVVVGPDRYGIRFERRAGRRRRGDVQLPNQPCEFRLRAPARTLADECADLRRRVAALETRAGAAITAPTAKAVRDLLSHRHILLAERVELEQRATALRAAHETLSSGWRRDAFDVDPDERQLLHPLDVGLEDLRTRLAEIPQLLLAASAWRQGERTETLSLIVAALVPPTLVAGVFGANVLPWAETTDGSALGGMLLLMVASGALAMAMVAWFVLDRVTAATGRVRRRSAMLVVLMVLGIGTAIAGCFVLGGGTTTNRPDEQQAIAPATTATRSEERAGQAVRSAAQR